MTPKNVRHLINLATLIVVIALVIVTIYWYDLGILSDVKVLQSYIARLGLTGAFFRCHSSYPGRDSHHSRRHQYRCRCDSFWPVVWFSLQLHRHRDRIFY